MCLNYVKTVVGLENALQDETEYIGYKVLIRGANKTIGADGYVRNRPVWKSYPRKEKVKRGVWLHDESVGVLHGTQLQNICIQCIRFHHVLRFGCDFDSRYPYNKGFHIFTGRSSAEKLAGNKRGVRVFKVKYKHVVAEGTQYGRKVVVARSYRILGEVQ